MIKKYAMGEKKTIKKCRRKYIEKEKTKKKKMYIYDKENTKK